MPLVRRRRGHAEAADVDRTKAGDLASFNDEYPIRPEKRSKAEAFYPLLVFPFVMEKGCHEGDGLV